jgi:hypothetical protein
MGMAKNERRAAEIGLAGAEKALGVLRRAQSIEGTNGWGFKNGNENSVHAKFSKHEYLLQQPARHQILPVLPCSLRAHPLDFASGIIGDQQ